ncbi:MAG: hypothetical protein ACK4V6_18260, partial [Microthrixaceae bacterium]
TVLGAGVAGAQTDPYVSPSSVVKPEVLSNEVSQAPAAAESAAVESSLAFTGGDAVGLALIGGVAVAAGTAITVARRRTVSA